jgi:dephospho-CoA kinase
MKCDSGIYVIGLTGGIASGKSTVSSMLSSFGAIVVDADKISRKVTETGSFGLEQIVAFFGRNILLPDGSLDRKKLGSIVFGNEEALNKLNSILHPVIDEKTCCVLDEIRKDCIEKEKPSIVIFDAPLLFEIGADKYVDEVWVVDVDRDLQLKRLMERDSFDYGEAMARINSQMPLSEKRRRAHEVIDNSGSLQETYQKVKELYEKAKRKTGIS